MKIPPSTAIAEFESFLVSIGARTAQSSEYATQKALWPSLLQFLQPIITGERIFGADAIENAAPFFQRDQTSVIDETASDRAIYFGLLSFTIAINNKQRGRYLTLSLDEITEFYRVQAFTPSEALASYGEYYQKASPAIEKLGNLFLVHHIEPKITDPKKLDDACEWFSTQFLCGVLLGQITDFLTLRDHQRERSSERQ